MWLRHDAWTGTAAADTQTLEDAICAAAMATQKAQRPDASAAIWDHLHAADTQHHSLDVV